MSVNDKPAASGVQPERAFSINLNRRQDRWGAFLSRLPADWPLPPIERFAAVDGLECQPPHWWKAPPGAWGCYQSHLAAIELADRTGAEVVWIFEDDCTFVDAFAIRFGAFMANVPADWGMLYLGGEHIHRHDGRPESINKHVVRPYNANRRHAYAVHRRAMPVVLAHLRDYDNLHPKHRGDHHVGTLHVKRAVNVYAPRQWLCGQAAGKSDIDSRKYPLRFVK